MTIQMKRCPKCNKLQQVGRLHTCGHALRDRKDDARKADEPRKRDTDTHSIEAWTDANGLQTMTVDRAVVMVDASVADARKQDAAARLMVSDQEANALVELATRALAAQQAVDATIEAFADAMKPPAAAAPAEPEFTGGQGGGFGGAGASGEWSAPDTSSPPSYDSGSSTYDSGSGGGGGFGGGGFGD